MMYIRLRRIVPPLAVLALVMVQSAARGADDEPRLVPAGAVFVPSVSVLTYVEQPVVHDDLKLTAQQRMRIDELRSTLQAADAATRVDGTHFDLKRAMRHSDDAVILLSEILTPGQIRRHHQIVMQQLLIRFGLVQLMQVAEMADLLAPEQRLQLPMILASAGVGAAQQAVARRPPGRAAPRQPAARPVQKPPQILDEFSNPDLANIESRQASDRYELGNDQISALLTDNQKKKLLDVLGPPVASHPSGSPPAILREGARSFAFPRIPAPEPQARSERVGGTVLARHWLMLALPGHEPIRQELELTSEQAARLPPYSGNPEEAGGLSAELACRLSPAQLSRLRQLALQFFALSFGKAALLEFKEVADALALRDDQRTAFAGLLQSEIRSTRRAVLEAVERDPERRPAFENEGAQHRDGVLTEQQRRQLSELLGKPFAETFPIAALRARGVRRLSIRAQAAPRLGYLTAVPAGYLFGRMQQVLQFTDWHREILYGPGDRDTNAETLLKSLPAEQKRRYLEIVLQGSIKSLGPAGIFLYQPVIDALSPDDKQRQQLLETLWEDTRRYLAVPLNELEDKLPALDQQTAESVDSILTNEQRATLETLLGESVEKLDLAPAQAALRAKSGGSDPAPAATNRRLVYPVRNGSASELAEIVRQRFRTGVGVLDTAGPVNNALRIAVDAEFYHELLAALPVFDRPRQRLIVDVMIAEILAPRDFVAISDFDANALDDRDFSGPIEEVRPRLEELFQKKKLAGLRQIRLVALEDLEVQHRCGEELQFVSGVNQSLGTRFADPKLRLRFVGAEIRATPRIIEGGTVMLELAVQNARTQGQEERPELGLGPDGPLALSEVITEAVSANLRIPLDQAVLAPQQQADGKSGPGRLRVVVAVRLAESTPP